MDIRQTREMIRRGKTIYDMNIRVGYYARVSTDKSDQLNSLENQQHYFEDMIRENTNWTFVGGFIDEGISGTQTRKREQFLKMIELGSSGGIDLILTKEISRFSRNTVDSIKYTEYLLKMGVIVYFIADNLNTIQEDAEFRLTIMSSLAQDEVRKLSERVKFGINRMIKDRKLIGSGLKGYVKKDGRYIIQEDEAKMIRYIFDSYVTGGISLKKIGENLSLMGYKNMNGEVYSGTSIAKFLTNPRYKGYYTARLTEVEDYKSHKKRRVPKDRQIIEKDERIPAIVSEEIWDRANYLYESKKRRVARHILNSFNASKYSMKIFCMGCGEGFIRCGGGNRKNSPSFVCKTYKKSGVIECASPIIKEEYLDNLFIEIFEEFFSCRVIDVALREYEKAINSRNKKDNDNIKRLEIIDSKRDRLLNLYLSGIIDEREFKKKYYEISRANNGNIEKKRYEIDKISLMIREKMSTKKNLDFLVREFVRKVLVEKVNNDRKKIKITVVFDFKCEKLVYVMDTVSGIFKKVNVFL